MSLCPHDKPAGVRCRLCELGLPAAKTPIRVGRSRGRSGGKPKPNRTSPNWHAGRGSNSRDRRVPEEAIIANFVKDGPPLALYDVGVGCYSEWRTLKRIWPGMEVFGCEPCLSEYQELLPIFTGKLIRVALGEQDGTALLSLSPHGQGGSTLFPREGQRSRANEEVEVWTLDRFDRWAGQPERILLWMDVEGAELAALRGGPELLASGRVHWLNLETRDVDDCHPTTADLTRFLAGWGYVPVHRYNVQGAYPEAPGDVIFVKGD